MDATANQPLDPVTLFLRAMQAMMGAANPAAAHAPQPDPAQLMRQWLAALAGPWGGNVAAAPPGDPWAQMLGALGSGGDLTEYWSRWYAGNSETLARAFDELLRAPEFVRASARALDDYASAVATQRRAVEMAARALPFATRADVTRLARLAVASEEKLDRLLDAGQVAERSDPADLTAAVTALSHRLDAIEAKLDRLLAARERDVTAATTVRQRTAAAAATAPAARKVTRARRERAAAADPAATPVRLVRGTKVR
ncbi:MAG TPA: hypothetical protein VGR57_17825 [Ktedonobacterales bacterium]|nr:hypothetical protein [Ktedonobacterales bacterium]